ncbi:MAG: hypothetical protein AB7L17_12770 [Ilumatobacteraceae bacterium]
MTGLGRPLGWDQIEAYLVEVGAELEHRGLTRTIIVVGGAYVAHRGVRASTTDVDTICELDAELRGVVATVADRHGLEPDWLNDRARPWRPATFDSATCETVVEAGGLQVLAPPPDIVVLMKISAGGRTPNDALDLRALWPATRFTDPDEAVAAFHAAYPHEDPDPHLADWIRAVIAG